MVDRSPKVISGQAASLLTGELKRFNFTAVEVSSIGELLGPSRGFLIKQVNLVPQVLPLGSAAKVHTDGPRLDRNSLHHG